VYEGFSEVKKAVEGVVFSSHQLTDDIGQLELATGDLVLQSHLIYQGAGHATWEAQTYKMGLEVNEWCGASFKHGIHSLLVEKNGDLRGPDWDYLTALYENSVASCRAVIESKLRFFVYLNILKNEQREIWNKYERRHVT
jgi:hypothetical protein